MDNIAHVFDDPVISAAMNMFIVSSVTSEAWASE